MQHRVGCRVCGAKSSSRFRDWRSYSHLESLEEVEFKVPKSDVICNTCSRAADRQTLKVCAILRQTVYSSLVLFRALIPFFYHVLLSSAQYAFFRSPAYASRSTLKYNSETRRGRG